MPHRRIARLTPAAKRVVGPELAAKAISRSPKISFKTPFGIGALAERLNTRSVIRDIAKTTARVVRRR